MSIPDDALPIFVTQVMPAGIRGLLIAAIMSAVLTSLGSGLAALSACIQVDFVRRWGLERMSSRASVLLARGLTLAWGLAVIGGGLMVSNLGKDNNIIRKPPGSAGVPPAPGLGPAKPVCSAFDPAERAPNLPFRLVEEPLQRQVPRAVGGSKGGSHPVCRKKERAGRPRSRGATTAGAGTHRAGPLASPGQGRRSSCHSARCHPAVRSRQGCPIAPFPAAATGATSPPPPQCHAPLRILQKAGRFWIPSRAPPIIEPVRFLGDNFSCS